MTAGSWPISLEQKQYVLLCLEDTAYRNEVKEKVLTENGFRSQLHRKKPKKKPMPLTPTRQRQEI